MSDEIYHGITFSDAPAQDTALRHSPDALDQLVLQVFSMTGWRLGWLVLPERAPELSRRGHGLSRTSSSRRRRRAAPGAAPARGGPCEAEPRAHVAVRAERRGARGLRRLGDAAGAQPTLAPAHGAFYVYADLSALGVTDAPALCAALLEDEGVAITPGTDFEDPASGLGARRVRFSYAGATAEVEEGGAPRRVVAAAAGRVRPRGVGRAAGAMRGRVKSPPPFSQLPMISWAVKLRRAPRNAAPTYR